MARSVDISSHPPLVRRIQIKYFRSIFDVKMDPVGHFTVITGGNDAGKSNILRALNLFFNGKTDWLDHFIFEKDFSTRRREEVRRDSIKGKQFIQIAVTFNRGGSFENTLPPMFTVTRTWFRDQEDPKQTDDLKNQFARIKDRDFKEGYAARSLSMFLNSIQYVYVPAVKDRDVFKVVLKYLQSSIFELGEKDGGDFIGEVGKFNEQLSKTARMLQEDFENSTGVSARISLPENFAELFQALRIRTAATAGGEPVIDIDARGDGIRLRLIPTILNYISERSTKRFMWGFEEPENSMEYKRAAELFERFASAYSRKSQVIITTHSPAFISLSDERCEFYRAKAGDGGTSVYYINKKNLRLDDDIDLAEELGHLKMQSTLHDILKKKLHDAEVMNDKLKELAKKIRDEIRPVVLTEGKTDAMIIKFAWNKLYQEDAPFALMACDTHPPGEGGGGAGANTLSKHLCSVLPGGRKTIGIFDNDIEGQKAFLLDNNFSSPRNESWFKKHRNGKAFAIILPAPAGKEEYVQAKNLPIEFLFDEQFLNMRVNEHGLEMRYKTAPAISNGVVIGQYVSEEKWHREIIKNSKVGFAEHVVPTFPVHAFEPFRQLFDKIKEILDIDGQLSEKVSHSQDNGAEEIVLPIEIIA
ncbi:ATP-binding protein [Azospirillum sp.]|uniref:ATP-dependent nuclease n=1 Tax=Azospirillum sp. TaxID=34012 RepID=UPI002D56B076|nr:ATP-binding protein [Azospirillum sp.]HYF85794.1 ATP-binding protein [Azospirillum sp.]